MTSQAQDTATRATPSYDSVNLHDNGDHDEHEEHDNEITPLPKLQMFIIFLIQISEPTTATVIYPFVNHLVQFTGVTGGDDRKTGYYAGLIVRDLFSLLVARTENSVQESVFFFAESFTVIFWGHLADSYGRRPILLFGPLGLSVAMVMFGTSTTFWPLVGWRCLQGVFNGNIGTIVCSVIFDLTM